MNIEQIRRTRARLKAKREKLEAELKKLELDESILHMKCPHRNHRQWSDGGGYGGPDMSSDYFVCDDCGFQK